MVGQWTIKDLFKIPFPSTPYTVIFSPEQIRLVGGCNGYSFDYNLNPSTQIITIGKMDSSSNNCAKSDDGLFVSGIQKIHKYLLTTANGIHTLHLYDNAGDPGYTL